MRLGTHVAAHGSNLSLAVFPDAVVCPLLRRRLKSRVPDQRVGVMRRPEAVMLLEAIPHERVVDVGVFVVARGCRFGRRCRVASRAGRCWE